MTETEDMARIIRENAGKNGKTKSGLAKALGKSSSAISSILDGTRRVQRHEVPIIRAYFELDDSLGVRIVGIGGAGPDGTVLMPGGGNLGMAPPLSSPKTTKLAAIELRGQPEVGPDGWYAYFDDLREPPTNALLGVQCAVEVEGGRVLIRTLAAPASGAKSRFDLIGTGRQAIRDARLVWAAPILGTLSGYAARLKG